MNLDYMFESPLFSVEKATKEQLKKYARVLWPIQVSFVTALPELCGTLCRGIGEQALAGASPEEERLKKILRIMFLSATDEMGHGRDKYGMMHHDLFSKQVANCTGLPTDELRNTWIRTTANWRLTSHILDSASSVENGLHMMYTVEQLAPRFFTHQETLFSSAADLKDCFHSTMHKQTELEHASEASEFMELVHRDEVLLDDNVKLWRDLCDDLYRNAFQEGNDTSTVTFRPTTSHDGFAARWA